jgi:hypothetical protein
MEALRSSEALVLTWATRCNTTDDGILCSHRRANLRSFNISCTFRSRFIPILQFSLHTDSSVLAIHLQLATDVRNDISEGPNCWSCDSVAAQHSLPYEGGGSIYEFIHRPTNLAACELFACFRLIHLYKHRPVAVTFSQLCIAAFFSVFNPHLQLSAFSD